METIKFNILDATFSADIHLNGVAHFPATYFAGFNVDSYKSIPESYEADLLRSIYLEYLEGSYTEALEALALEYFQNNLELIASDHHGIYQSATVAEYLLENATNLKGRKRFLNFIANENNIEKDGYWDQVTYKLEAHTYVIEGVEYSIHQNGDTWLIPTKVLNDISELGGNIADSVWNSLG